MATSSSASSSSSSSSSSVRRIPVLERGEDREDWEEEFAEWEQETLDSFSSKLVKWQDHADDVCLIKEQNELNELQQLAKIGITYGFEGNTEFDEHVFVTACEMGCTKALRAVIRQLLATHNNDREHLMKYIQNKKEVDRDLLSPELAEIQPNALMSAIPFCIASGFLPGLRVLIEEALPAWAVPFYLTYMNPIRVAPMIEMNLKEREKYFEQTPRVEIKSFLMSPLVLALFGKKYKCILYALENGSVPYEQHQMAWKDKKQQFTFLWTVIERRDKFIFDQIMGRRFRKTLIYQQNAPMVLVRPIHFRTLDLINYTLEQISPDRRIIVQIDLLKRDTRQAERELRDHVEGRTVIQGVRLQEHIAGLRRRLEANENLFKVLEKQKTDSHIENSRVMQYMAIVMIDRHYWRMDPTIRDSYPNVKDQEGNVIDYYDLAHWLGNNLVKSIDWEFNGDEDCRDPFVVTSNAVEMRADLVFDHMIKKAYLPIFDINTLEEDDKLAPFTAEGYIQLIDSVVSNGTPRMLEILVLEEDVNPFSRQFSIYHIILTLTLNNVQYYFTEPQQARMVKKDMAAVLVKYLLHIVDTFPNYKGRPLREFEQLRDANPSEDLRIIHLAAICGDAELLAKAIINGDPINSKLSSGHSATDFAILFDNGEVFEALFEYGIQLTPEQRATISEKPNVALFLNSKERSSVANLRSLALSATYAARVDTSQIPPMFLFTPMDPHHMPPSYPKRTPTSSPEKSKLIAESKKRKRSPPPSPSSSASSSPSSSSSTTTSSSSSSVGSEGEREEKRRPLREQIQAIFTACRQGNAAAVSSLLQENPKLVYAKTKSGMSIQDYTRSHNNHHILSLLSNK